MVFDATSSAAFELARGRSRVYVTATATAPELDAGAPVLVLRLVDLDAASVQPAPATTPFDIDAWQHRTVVGDDLVVIGTLGGGGRRFQVDTRTWSDLPPLPGSFAADTALDLVGSAGGVIVVRERGGGSDSGGRYAVSPAG